MSSLSPLWSYFDYTKKERRKTVRNLKAHSMLFVLLAVGFVLAFHSAGEAQTPKALSFRIASADLGSAWYIYGAAVGELIKKEIPGASCDILPTAATIANVKMLEKGDAELGFSFSNVDGWAQRGIISFPQTIITWRSLSPRRAESPRWTRSKKKNTP
jgi:TRAP-type uncharacterized transport system substrate-binding protein